MKELWKDIPGFEGRYQVSNQGRVRSLPRHVLSSNGRVCFFKGQLLRPGPMKSGHLSVVLGRGNSRQVHQLVMLAFFGEKPRGHEVLHLNHNPADNRLCNLRYGTRSENMRMDYEAGKRKTPLQFICSDNGRRRPENVYGCDA